MGSIKFLACGFLLIFFLVPLRGSVMADAPPVYLDWNVSFSTLAPLGVEKQVIVINDQFPGPLLNVTTNDVLNINVRNNLPEPFLLTWNGVQMRRNSWQDGVQETNCPILPGQNWTHSFQVKDQIGSFFYYPSLMLQKAGGGYGPIRVNNRVVIPVPFPKPLEEYDILIGDWYNADHRDLRASLDEGNLLPNVPDGILINGLGSGQANFTVQPGATYRLRISNVGLRTSLNFRIQNHQMLLVETEGSYTIKQYYQNLDIHVGQSYSVLVTANQSAKAYYMVASSRFLDLATAGVGILRYVGANGTATGLLPPGPDPFDYSSSINQARSIRWDLAVGAARPNPQGSYHYGLINVSRTIVLQNSIATFGGHQRFIVNGISFVHPDTPLKLLDYFQLNGTVTLATVPDLPEDFQPLLGTSMIKALYRDFIQIVFENPLDTIQIWHMDGYNVFVVGMDAGTWDCSKRSGYNMLDAIWRSTVQVYPHSWTAVMLELDNQGMWNLRSQEAEKSYLGQELYVRVKGEGEDDPSVISVRDEEPIPDNVIRCGRAASA